jgi:hypothetical protein
VPKIIIHTPGNTDGERILRPPLTPEEAQSNNDTSVVYFRDKNDEGNNRFVKVIMNDPTSVDSGFQLIEMYIDSQNSREVNIPK